MTIDGRVQPNYVMRGGLTVESSAGHGTTFTLTIIVEEEAVLPAL